MACSQCKKVKYCGRECQRDDWAEHRKVCRKQNTTPSKESNSKNSLETLLVDSGKTDQESDGHFFLFHNFSIPAHMEHILKENYFHYIF